MRAPDLASRNAISFFMQNMTFASQAPQNCHQAQQFRPNCVEGSSNLVAWRINDERIIAYLFLDRHKKEVYTTQQCVSFGISGLL